MTTVPEPFDGQPSVDALSEVYELFQLRGVWPRFSAVDRHLARLGIDDPDALLHGLPPGSIQGVAAGAETPDGTEIRLSLQALAAIPAARPDVFAFAACVARAAVLSTTSPAGAEVSVDRADVEEWLTTLPAFESASDDVVKALGIRLYGLWQVAGLAQTLSGHSAFDPKADLAVWKATVRERGVRRYAGLDPREEMDRVVEEFNQGRHATWRSNAPSRSSSRTSRRAI